MRVALFGILALAALPALAGCRAERPPAAASPVRETALSRALEAHFAAKSPSGAFLFSIRGEPAFAKGYGVLAEGGAPLTADAVFPIGSLTKQFTATAILQLAARGKLALGDRLDRFFPEVPEDKRGITVRQLLAHK